MKCPICGKRVTADVRVCEHCGKRMPRPKKKGTKPKLPLFTTLSHRQLLIAGVVGMLAVLVLLLIVLPGGRKQKQALGPECYDAQITIEQKRAGGEMAARVVYGEVIASHMRATQQGIMTVRSLHSGMVYTFAVGWHTSYHPRRYPAIGELVKAYYRSDEDLLKATQVIIDQ